MSDRPAVLILDDDRIILHTLQEQLSRESYDVTVASEAEQALHALSGRSFAVILADQTMPQMNGLEFLRRCREMQPHSSRILITGVSVPPGIQEAVLRGDVFRFLTKPWTRLDLVLALRQATERHELLRRLAQAEEEPAAERRFSADPSPAGGILEELVGGDGGGPVQERFWQVLSRMDDAIWVSDAETNELLYFSPVHARIWGRPVPELCGATSWLDTIHPADRDRVRQAALRDQRRDGYDQEYRIVRPNGEVRWVRDRAFPVMNEDGSVTRIAGVAEDITDRKAASGQLEMRVRERTEELAWANLALESEVSERRRAEVQLRESNQRLQQALQELHDTQQQVIQQERLRALGRMASGVAHDFNNALIPILGYTELLLERPELLENREKTNQYLRLIRTAAKDASSVVGQLREFYRQRDEAEIFEPVDLAEAVGEAVSMTQPRWRDEALAGGRQIGVHSDLQPVPTVTCNGAEVREVVTNLMFNATDALPNGGNIWVRTYPGADGAYLEVRDDGVGMTEDVKARCMEPFVTTKGERGTGLGLAMVYGIVQRHQGSIDIESEVGAGSLFRIRLPFYDPPPPTEPSPRYELKRTLRVLVTDDEEVARDIVSLFLRNDNHEVVLATNALEALKILKEQEFDLLITDHAMPGMTGEAFTQTVRSAGLKVPILMLTGFGEIMNSAGNVPPGVDKVVNKPVTIEALRNAIAEVMREG